MNLSQLQYISDHLTMPECRKLSEALYMDGAGLEYVLTGENELNVSCITLLLQWDRSDQGRGRTFHVLATRLSQIKRQDLADYLSQAVYGEKASQVSPQSALSSFRPTPRHLIRYQL